MTRLLGWIDQSGEAMKRVAVLLPLLAGCASAAPKYNTPPVLRFYPLKAHFTLYRATSANACAPEDQHSNRSHDPSAAGPGHIFEQAKIKAMGGADGFIVTSVQVDYVNGSICTTVRGRPYAIESIEAVPPGEVAAHNAPPSASADDNSRDMLPLPSTTAPKPPVGDL